MKRKLFFATVLLVLYSQLLFWFCKERAVDTLPYDIGLEGKAIVRQYAADVFYFDWYLEGASDRLRALRAQQALRQYAGSLVLVANWYDGDSEKLNAYAELRLAVGRLAWLARKTGDEQAYAQYMAGALAVSQRYADLLAAHGGAGYAIDTEAEMIELVELLDTSLMRLMRQALAEQEQERQQSAQRAAAEGLSDTATEGALDAAVMDEPTAPQPIEN